MVPCLRKRRNYETGKEKEKNKLEALASVLPDGTSGIYLVIH